MNAVFVTGTDTGVGKTVFAGLLARRLSEQGLSVITQKWIETGTKGFSRDISQHLRFMGARRKDLARYEPHVCPYSFSFPASPHLASRLERRTVRAAKIKKSFRLLQKAFDFVVVEGTGGALVPYSGKRLLLDIAKDLKLPVIIVAANRLGAINHTLLTIEAIRRRGMKIAAVIFNDMYKGKKIIENDNIKTVHRLTGEKVYRLVL
jgi:dethiobiotin synthetase